MYVFWVGLEWRTRDTKNVRVRNWVRVRVRSGLRLVIF